MSEPMGPLGLAVCDECHAVVNREAFQLHLEWHDRIELRIKAARDYEALA